MSTKKNYKRCFKNQAGLMIVQLNNNSSSPTGNSFTPWFKLIARDFLFGWWDQLLERRTQEGTLDAKSLAGLVDGTKVVKMV
jgi:hypothetical protein